MYFFLLVFHSAFRWLVLIFLLFAIYKAYTGYFNHRSFTKTDNLIRHWTATVAHIQLILGIILYIKSPIILYFWGNFEEARKSLEITFFGLFHAVLMFVSVIVITIGSALAKRKRADEEKFRTILIWFSIALAIIFIAIPWPFSPFINRPYFRLF